MADYNPAVPLVYRDIGHRLKQTPERKLKGAPLDNDDRLIVIWGWSRAWSHRKIADAIGGSKFQVDRYRAKVKEDPGIIFDLPLLTQVNKTDWRCRWCNEVRKGWTRAARHCLHHFLPLEMAKYSDLSQAPRML